ncbi:MAG: alpha-L-rhamnosidase C-terminal domain-containing protein, partial [Armatimonadota bacterium]
RGSRAPGVTTPYMNFYVASALFAAGRSRMALDLIRTYWGAMIARGATTFWEKFDPEWPTPYEQPNLSYCHGWSSGPGQLLPAYIGGVWPAKPGFEQALIAPELAGLAWVKAVVPTPKGVIKVDWKQDRGCPVGSVTLPNGCSGRLVLPAPPSGMVYAVDGTTAKPVLEGERHVLALKGGGTRVLSLVPEARR